MNFLYNGVELPALPEWDKTTYPYAMIYHATNDSAGNALYDFRVFTSPFVFRLNQNYNYYQAYFGTDATGLRGNHWISTSGVKVNEDGSTTDLGELTLGTSLYGYSGWTSTFTKTNVLWANFDILDYDNSEIIHLPASDPVPVDPPAVAPEVEPKAFMVGSWMGQIVKCYGIGI